MREPLNPLTPKILALWGLKSYGLIAKELGISRCMVAGVIWRAKRRDEVPPHGPRRGFIHQFGGPAALQRLPVRNQFSDQGGVSK